MHLASAASSVLAAYNERGKQAERVLARRVACCYSAERLFVFVFFPERTSRLICHLSPVYTSRVDGPSTRLVETRARQHGLC